MKWNKYETQCNYFSLIILTKKIVFMPKGRGVFFVNFLHYVFKEYIYQMASWVDIMHNLFIQITF